MFVNLVIVEAVYKGVSPESFEWAILIIIITKALGKRKIEKEFMNFVWQLLIQAKDNF